MTSYIDSEVPNPVTTSLTHLGPLSKTNLPIRGAPSGESIPNNCFSKSSPRDYSDSKTRSSMRAPGLLPPPFFLYIYILIFIYLSVPGLSYGMPDFSFSMWNLVPQPGIEPRPLALGVQSLSHWTSRKDPGGPCLVCFCIKNT